MHRVGLPMVFIPHWSCFYRKYDEYGSHIRPEWCLQSAFQLRLEPSSFSSFWADEMRSLLIVLICFTGVSKLSAEVVTYVETVDGNLSNEGLAPTELAPFDIGRNFVDAGLNDGSGQSDAFTFEIMEGQELTEIILSDFNLTGDRIFFGIHDDSAFPVSSFDLLNSNAVGDEFLGGFLIGNSLNTNLLPDIGNNAFGIGTGFVGNLGEGSYTVYLQQTSAQNTQYTVDFTVAAAVPEPSTYAFVGLVLAGLVYIRRKRSRLMSQSAI